MSTWYIEGYAPDGIRAKWHRRNTTFEDVIATLEMRRDGEILRVLCPVGATAEELKTLRGHGAAPF